MNFLEKIIHKIIDPSYMKLDDEKEYVLAELRQLEVDNLLLKMKAQALGLEVDSNDR